MELSSQASSTSSSGNTILERFNSLSGSITNEKTPKTLKVISYILLFVFLLIIVTSTLTLILTISNIQEAQFGVLVSQKSMDRMNSVINIRLLTRTIINIANDRSSNVNELVDDRIEFFAA